MGYRLPNELEQLDMMERIERAIELKVPMTVTFFKRKTFRHTYTQNGQKHVTEYEGFTPVRRRVEPWMIGFHISDGHPYVRVISLSPTDEKGPMYRTLRLDRIAISSTTGKPLLTIHPSRHRYCQGLIDVAEAKEKAKAEATV